MTSRRPLPRRRLLLLAALTDRDVDLDRVYLCATCSEDPTEWEVIAGPTIATQVPAITEEQEFISRILDHRRHAQDPQGLESTCPTPRTVQVRPERGLLRRCLRLLLVLLPTLLITAREIPWIRLELERVLLWVRRLLERDFETLSAMWGVLERIWTTNHASG
uniref:Uncharacterized protein n=1 Tax=Frankliniella occidentalis associated densovirus 1 TaxID=2771466 RepID=A0A7H1D344_9VIRU|nr:hypothetical protein [Frankliniella occidentalis associated densovirus 1]